MLKLQLIFFQAAFNYFLLVQSLYEEFAYLTVDPELDYTTKMSTCFDVCLREWKVSYAGGYIFPPLDCANRCE